MEHKILLILNAMWPFCLVSELMGIETALLDWAWGTLKLVPFLFPKIPPEEGLQAVPESLFLGFDIRQFPHSERKKNTGQGKLSSPWDSALTREFSLWLRHTEQTYMGKVPSHHTTSCGYCKSSACPLSAVRNTDIHKQRRAGDQNSL